MLLRINFSILKSLIQHNVINCPDTAVHGKIDMDAGAGRDFRPDHFPFAVEHMTATVENVTARTLAVNNESFGRLISSRLASFNSYGRVRCGHRHAPFP